MSIGRYFTEMLDPSMNWEDVAEMVRLWDGQFCLKGVMSLEDARRGLKSAAPALCCPTTGAGSWMAHAQHSINWRRSSTASAIG